MQLLFVTTCLPCSLVNQVLRKLTASKEERDTLSEVASMLTPLKNKLKLAVQNAGPAAKRKPGFV